MKEVKLSLFSYGMILVVKDLKPQQKTLRTDKNFHQSNKTQINMHHTTTDLQRKK